jgi:hypothetical protein
MQDYVSRKARKGAKMQKGFHEYIPPSVLLSELPRIHEYLIVCFLVLADFIQVFAISLFLILTFLLLIFIRHEFTILFT